MLTHRLQEALVKPCVAAILLGIASVSLIPTLAMTANDAGTPGVPVAMDPARGGVVEPSLAQAEARDAAARFLRAMSAADAEAIWMFASEEEHDAFQTEDAALDAYADAFPALTQARGVTFERFWQEGDMPFVQVSLTTGSAKSHRATMGFWLDDAGDWKLLSCEVKPVSDLVAGL